MQSLPMCKDMAVVRVNCTANPCFSLCAFSSALSSTNNCNATLVKRKGLKKCFPNDLNYRYSRFSYCNTNCSSDSESHCGSSVLLFSSSCWERNLGGGGGVCPSSTLLQNKIITVLLISFTTAHYLFGF